MHSFQYPVCSCRMGLDAKTVCCIIKTWIMFTGCYDHNITAYQNPKLLLSIIIYKCVGLEWLYHTECAFDYTDELIGDRESNLDSLKIVVWQDKRLALPLSNENRSICSFWQYINNYNWLMKIQAWYFAWYNIIII